MNGFNEKEFEDLKASYNPKAYCREVKICYESESFFNKMKKSIETDRRGEVVFCVIRPSGKVIAVTCSEYPEGVFRIPTGGINYNEDIVPAVFRETAEELGISAEIRGFAGVLKIRFEYGNESEMFYSYIFIMKELGGRLLEDASDDEVSEVAEAGLSKLSEIADRLLKIKGSWSEWGRFRHATTGAVLEYLKENAEELGIASDEDSAV